MRGLTALVLAAVMLPPAAFAQVAPAPNGSFTTELTGTITTTGTYQLVLPASQMGVRKSCMVQNNGTHTMLVFFGSAAPTASSGRGFAIGAGVAVSCGLPGGGVALDAVWIEGTAGDGFEYASQP